jgi:hypothetical protein
MIKLLVWWLIFNASIVAPSTVTTIIVTKLVMIKMALFATMKEGKYGRGRKRVLPKTVALVLPVGYFGGLDDRVVRSAW